MAILIVPVGYLRQRHIDGVNYLLKELKVTTLQILYDSKHVKEFTRPTTASVEKNARAVAIAFAGIKPLVEGWNPTDPENVANTFTQIYEKGVLAGDKEIYVDITSTPKIVIVISTLFAVLFGFKVYYVRSKGGKTYPISERMNRMFTRLVADETVYANLTSTLEDKRIGNELKKQRLSQCLSEACARITSELKAASEGGEVVTIPLRGTEVDFSTLDREILASLFKHDGSVDSLKSLGEHLKRKELSTLGYRVGKLANWGLVTASGTREKRVKLTPIGKGVAGAISSMYEGGNYPTAS